MKHFILSIIMSTTLCLSTFSMENFNEKTNIEAAVERLWSTVGSTTKWEEISINNVKYRKGEVVGDNDCGVHSLNALFPGHNLSRSSILDKFTQILKNPQHEHHISLKNVLADDLINLLKTDLTSIMLLSSKPSYPQILANFPSLVNDLEEDLFSSSEHYIQLAKSNTTALETFINCFRDENVLFISIPNTQTGSNGLLGLVCEIYNFNIQLINHTNNGQPQTFTIGRHPAQQKDMIFRSNHFSPLCLINDVEERNRFAAYYAHEVILKGISVFKGKYISSEDLEALKRMLAQINIVGHYTMGNQKTQALTESLCINGSRRDVMPKINIQIQEKKENPIIAAPTNVNLDDLPPYIVDSLRYFVQEKSYNDNSLRVYLINEYHKLNDSQYERIIASVRSRFQPLGNIKDIQTQEEKHRESPIIATPTNINLCELFPRYIVDNLIYFVERGWKDNAIVIDLKNKGYHFDDSKYEQIIASVRSKM